MNITRHNYEEFFILYMDNELSSDDRRHVESFVNENPDLKNEFDLLSQTRMTPDDNLVFDGKQQLLKTALPGPISETNFEEWLLLYIDNEVTAQEKIAVQEFVAGHPSAETTLQQLQKTKLHPEHAVVFQNKEVLYRREKRTPVVAFRVWRIAVAAALLLAISTAAFLVFNDNKTKHGQIASEKIPGANSTRNDSSDKRINETDITETDLSKNDVSSNKEVDPSDNLVADKQKNSVHENEKNRQHITVSSTPEEKLITQNKITPQEINNLPDTKNNPNVNNDTEKGPIAMVDLPKKEDLTSNSNNKPIDVVTPDNASSLDNGKTSVPEPDYALSTDDSGKKNKLRGFFRKVTRTFEKRTNIKATDDEDRLLLAGISIKL